MKTITIKELIQIIENSLYDEDIYIKFGDNSTELHKGVMYASGFEIDFKTTYRPLFEKFLKGVLSCDSWWEVTINDVECKVVE